MSNKSLLFFLAAASVATPLPTAAQQGAQRGDEVGTLYGHCIQVSTSNTGNKTPIVIPCDATIVQRLMKENGKDFASNMLGKPVFEPATGRAKIILSFSGVTANPSADVQPKILNQDAIDVANIYNANLPIINQGAIDEANTYNANLPIVNQAEIDRIVAENKRIEKENQRLISSAKAVQPKAVVQKPVTPLSLPTQKIPGTGDIEKNLATVGARLKQVTDIMARLASGQAQPVPEVAKTWYGRFGETIAHPVTAFRKLDKINEIAGQANSIGKGVAVKNVSDLMIDGKSLQKAKNLLATIQNQITENERVLKAMGQDGKCAVPFSKADRDSLKKMQDQNNMNAQIVKKLSDQLDSASGVIGRSNSFMEAINGKGVVSGVEAGVWKNLASIFTNIPKGKVDQKLYDVTRIYNERVNQGAGGTGSNMSSSAINNLGSLGGGVQKLVKGLSAQAKIMSGLVAQFNKNNKSCPPESAPVIVSTPLNPVPAARRANHKSVPEPIRANPKPVPEAIYERFAPKKVDQEVIVSLPMTELVAKELRMQPSVKSYLGPWTTENKSSKALPVCPTVGACVDNGKKTHPGVFGEPQ